MQAGAIGKPNMVEAWWDRNDAIGAWQYSIPPDATPENIDWDRFLGRAPKVPFEPQRLFRWRCYRDYGTGVAGDLFVHLFSGMHFVMGAIGPTRVYATGGLRFWKDGRDVPDVMLGMYDYPETARHPAFNLALRVNFVDGGSESSGFRFIGSEGILTIDDGVTVSKRPGKPSPATLSTLFRRRFRTKFLKQYFEQYPRSRSHRRRHSSAGRGQISSRRKATATIWIITAISWPPSAAASRWWKTPPSDSAPPVPPCSQTSATSKSASANGTRKQ